MGTNPRKSLGTLDKCHKTFDKWLSLEPSDHKAIDVVLATALDRDVDGDPTWLFLIAPSGGTKTEILRGLNEYDKIYTLSSLTTKTFISGKIVYRNKPEGKKELVVQGLLPKINGKVLVIKDFTVILSMPDVVRNEIFGQLRDIHDGYYEKGFGNLPYPIKIKADIGLISGVTPAIDKYQKVTTMLGERFLKVRLHPKTRETSKQASLNRGKEKQMREEIGRAVAEFLNSLKFNKMPQLSEGQRDDIIKMAEYIALMRVHVYAKLNYKGQIIEMDTPEPEIPTRASKQLSKLAVSLALLRGHDTVMEEDLDTVRRVARDTGLPRRQTIVEIMGEQQLKLGFDEGDIAGHSKLHYNTVRREFEKMVSLGILDVKNTNEVSLYKFSDSFKELVESVGLKEFSEGA